jgi:tetratricopeptide (TPR) repeat protein
LRDRVGRRGHGVFQAEFEMKRKVMGAVLLLAMAGGMAAVAGLQKTIDRDRKMLHVESEDVTLVSPSLVKHLSLEFAPLMAAIYWTRTVQYYGEKHHFQDPNLQLMWPMLDITTTLDPNLIPPYRFGSTFLSAKQPEGAQRPDLAVKLLEKGIAANPEQWRLYQDLGNVYYFDLKNYLKASQAFESGSKNPQAPIWMKIMAAKIAGDGESLETSYFLWQDIYQNSHDKQVRENAETHLKLVTVEMDCKKINSLADEYQRKSGKRPQKMLELVQAGLLTGIPRDPEGFPYVFGEDGKAEVNLNSPLLEKILMERN